MLGFIETIITVRLYATMPFVGPENTIRFHITARAEDRPLGEVRPSLMLSMGDRVVGGG